jgi:hypothetical protein
MWPATVRLRSRPGVTIPEFCTPRELYEHKERSRSVGPQNLN